MSSVLISLATVMTTVHIFLIIIRFENVQKRVRCKTVSLDGNQFILKCHKIIYECDKSFVKMYIPVHKHEKKSR